MKLKKALEINQKNWDSRVSAHLSDDGDFYDHKKILAGGLSLRPLEKKFLTDLDGKRILHLMCHIGHDTISLAQMGAKVVGVDISEKSLDAAKSFAKQLNLKIDFQQGDIHEYESSFENKFDYVLLSYGTLCWIKDLKLVFKYIYKYLKMNGLFLLVDSHPLISILDYENNYLTPKYNYFHHPDGEIFSSGSSYQKWP